MKYYILTNTINGISDFVEGWVELPDDTDITRYNRHESFIEVSKNQWDVHLNDRVHKTWIYRDGTLTPCTETPKVFLNVQATSALKRAVDYVYTHYSVINLPTPDEWVDYIKQLQILKDTDSQYGVLPTPPTS